MCKAYFKKSQISQFILIGIVLLIAISFFSYLNSKELGTSELEETLQIPLRLEPLKNYVENCIKETGLEALLLIGRHGGYAILPEYSTKELFTKTAYYFYVDRNLMPPKTRVEQEISDYIDDQIHFCLRNFDSFKEQGFEIGQGAVNTNIIIAEKNVVFNLNFPLTVKIQETTYNIDKFSNKIDNFRLKTIYDVSENITLGQMQNPDSICLSCLVNLGIEHDLHIDMNELGNSSISFTITDFNSKIDDLPYKYIFANKYAEYSCSNPPPDASPEFYLECVQAQIAEFNYSLSIDEIPDLEAIVNASFVYDANATGANVNFTDFTNLFDINEKTGLINFTPIESQIGIHFIWLRAIDSLGNEDYETFQLNITNST